MSFVRTAGVVDGLQLRSSLAMTPHQMLSTTEVQTPRATWATGTWQNRVSKNTKANPKTPGQKASDLGLFEPPIGIEPMTYSLRGSYIHPQHFTGQHLPLQPRQLSGVSMVRLKSCMPKIHPREPKYFFESFPVGSLE
jgi:hypothetical protein